MRCYICDTPLEDPKFDRRDGKVRPCSSCEDVIDDALADFEVEDVEVQLELPFDEEDV